MTNMFTRRGITNTPGQDQDRGSDEPRRAVCIPGGIGPSHVQSCTKIKPGRGGSTAIDRFGESMAVVQSQR